MREWKRFWLTASSRTPPSKDMHKSETALVAGTFKRALDEILARVFVSAAAKNLPLLAVAYSGGLDSSVLLHLAHDYAAGRGIQLLAFHVHHGLSPNADAWLAHCRDTCQRLGIAFDARKVSVDADGGRGLEAAARNARYAALGELCRAHRVPLLLTAHHQDDQAETVLLQMLRGAGLAGLSGMEECSAAPALLGDAATIIARPLLAVRRDALEEWARGAGMAHIEDESNLNPRHPRNALRNEVLPLVARHFPAYRDCLARSAHHAQSAQRLLDELATQDLSVCANGDGLDAKQVKCLNDDRVANLLRHWLGLRGMRPPSTAWLHEACTQLLDGGEEAQVCVSLEGRQLRRYRGRIVLVTAQDASDAEPQVFRWNGEEHMDFPAYGGALHFEAADDGVDPEWLCTQDLRLQVRAGGGKLKLAPNRHTRSLKDHYQALGVPAWERPHLPLVYAGNALLFAAGIGQDCRSSHVGGGIRLRWEPYTPRRM